MALIRILCIAPESYAEKISALRSDDLPDHCESRFKTLHRTDESRLNDDLANFRPHVILTAGSWMQYQKLCEYPLMGVRAQWISNLDEPPTQIARDIQQNFSNLMIQDRFKDAPLVSVFTPTHETPVDALLRAYESLKRQSYSNWEWVIYDDSLSSDL